MSVATSSWIPRRRIGVAAGLAASLAVAGIAGSAWSPVALLLLAPAIGAGWAAFLMLRIAWQLAPDGGGWERRIHELVAARLSVAPDAEGSVLDIGCGDASLLATILARAPGLSVTGVDLWGDAWDYARSACEVRLAAAGHHATLRRMDAAQLDLPDASFDAVVSVMCFHEVRAPDGSGVRGPLLALREAVRVLRPGGAFVLVDRFADPVAYGTEADLAAVLAGSTGLHRVSLVTALDVPWPLRSKRALGPVELVTGRKAPAP